MKLHVFPTKSSMGAAAADYVAEAIAASIAQRGQANVVFATGMSQFEMLDNLVHRDIEWHRVTGFHLDEYVGLPISHPASFRRYLQERLIDRVAPMANFYFVNGDHSDPIAECRRLGAIISEHPIDVACVGIGENGHLAFNDPPADFETDDSFLVVDLDVACRKQQLGEGWFTSLDAVPFQAITMSIREIMNSKCVVCTVPDQRKAYAVSRVVDGPVTNQVPASILKRHPDCTLFLDKPAASRLSTL